MSVVSIVPADDHVLAGERALDAAHPVDAGGHPLVVPMPRSSTLVVGHYSCF